MAEGRVDHTAYNLVTKSHVAVHHQPTEAMTESSFKFHVQNDFRMKQNGINYSNWCHADIEKERSCD